MDNPRFGRLVTCSCCRLIRLLCRLAAHGLLWRYSRTWCLTRRDIRSYNRGKPNHCSYDWFHYSCPVTFALANLSKLSPDTLLGIVSHGTLAIGLVLLSISSDVRVDLMGYLFGDLLAIGYEHIILLLITTCFTLGFMYFYWDALLAVTISPELAKIEGRPVARINIALILLMAVTVALAMKVVGVLLISAMLIIPPATARALSQTPQQMLFFSCTVGVLAVTLGIAASFQWDTPTGPSIIVASLCLFLLSLLGKPCTSL